MKCPIDFCLFRCAFSSLPQLMTMVSAYRWWIEWESGRIMKDLIILGRRPSRVWVPLHNCSGQTQCSCSVYIMIVLVCGILKSEKWLLALHVSKHTVNLCCSETSELLILSYLYKCEQNRLSVLNTPCDKKRCGRCERQQLCDPLQPTLSGLSKFNKNMSCHQRSTYVHINVLISQQDT